MGAKMLNYDERVRITNAYERYHDAELVADMFGICEREVYRLEAKKKAGDLAIRTHDRGRKPKLSPEQHEQIRKLFEDKPDITLKDMIKALSLPISESRLCVIVKREGYRVKKKVMHASEQKRPRCTGKTQSLSGRDSEVVR